VSLSLPVLFKSVDHFCVWRSVLSLTECTCSYSLVSCLVFIYSISVLKHLFQTAWFLAAFPKQLGKSTISFVMSVPPPSFPHETTWLPSDRFTWDWYWGLFDRRHVPVLAKLQQTEEALYMKTDLHLWLLWSLTLPWLPSLPRLPVFVVTTFVAKVASVAMFTVVTLPPLLQRLAVLPWLLFLLPWLPRLPVLLCWL